MGGGTISNRSLDVVQDDPVERVRIGGAVDQLDLFAAALGGRGDALHQRGFPRPGAALYDEFTPPARRVGELVKTRNEPCGVFAPRKKCKGSAV